MLLEISDSLLIVLKANLNLLFTILSTLISVVLGSGHAMLKFLFNTVSHSLSFGWFSYSIWLFQIIFFTTLYYLLQSSKERYAPIAMNINSSWGTRLADALEDSVSSVLVATMKLSLFHGLFTWLTHTVSSIISWVLNQGLIYFAIDCRCLALTLCFSHRFWQQS